MAELQEHAATESTGAEAPVAQDTGGDHEGDNKFQKAISAWRSMHRASMVI